MFILSSEGAAISDLLSMLPFFLIRAIILFNFLIFPVKTLISWTLIKLRWPCDPVLVNEHRQHRQISSGGAVPMETDSTGTCFCSSHPPLSRQRLSSHWETKSHGKREGTRRIKKKKKEGEGGGCGGRGRKREGGGGEERKRRKEKGSLPVKLGHLQPNASLTDILPNKVGEEFMSEVLSTEPETKTLGRVMYPELSVGWKY